MTGLITTIAPELAPHHAEKVAGYVRASRADATLRGYKDAMAIFTAWCADHGHVPIPASAGTMAAFLADQAERYRPSTLNKLVSAIAYAHRLAGHPFDRKAFGEVLAGIRRTHGTAPRQMAALVVDDIRRIVGALPDTIQGKRDRALLLIGFAGALRRSELVGLDVGERGDGGTGSILLCAAGARITLHRSKTDQEGAGIVKAIPRSGELDPVAALEDWLAAAGITDGPVFRPIDKAGRVGARTLWRRGQGAPTSPRLTDRSVADIVKRAAGAAGYDPRRLAGHSLRAGFATSAAAAEVTGENIARHVGWTSTQMTARYVREAQLFKNNPLRKVLGQ